MKTIVVPLDGSALAEQVLPYVQLYASLLKAQIELLRVVTDEEQRTFLMRHTAELHLSPLSLADKTLSEDAIAALVEHPCAYLGARADELRASGLEVRTHVTTGTAAEAIVEASATHSNALIMLATHGYSGLRRWAIGSTADKVVHSTSLPVFLVRAGAASSAPRALRRVVVPLDGSALAAQALPIAVELAARAGADLILLQAVLPFTEFAAAFTPLGRPIPVPRDLITEEIEHTRQELELVAERIHRPEVTTSTIVELGYPADVILDEAGKHQADLIVMATHGRSGLRRWMLGSVADKVLHASHTPLLLVRAREAELPGAR
jgi:nucleotide-binding universal stress UspA family protein